MQTEWRPDRMVHEDLDFGDTAILERQPYRCRRSPLMITLADPKIASQDIQKMLELGVNIVKFKTSHCTAGERIRLLGQLDKATSFLCKKHAVPDWPITTCIGLKTCIMKTGFLENGGESVVLNEGQSVVLIYDLALFDKCTARMIFVDNPYIAVEFKPTMMISIDRDEITLQCQTALDDKSVRCVVTKEGTLTNMRLVTMRGGERFASPLVTKKDFEFINFALENQIDMLICNYARKPETVQKVKDFIGKEKKRPIIIAGICTPQGLENIDEIIKEADGIAFCRDFLAFTIENSNRLGNIQKVVGAKCQQAGKPFFISGEVYRRGLEKCEFFDNETADITNAILDGATGFVLKECTNIDTALEVIRAMNEVCRSVEPLTNTKTDFWRILEGIRIPVNAAEACAISCAAVAHQIRARIIVIPTVTGHTAKTLMWLRPASMVVAVSTKKSTLKRLQSYRCVVPLLFEDFEAIRFKNWYKAVEARVNYAVEYVVRQNWIKLGDNYVTLQRGSEDSAFCDMVRVWQVTISKKPLVECPDETAKKDPLQRSTITEFNVKLFNV